MVPGIVGLHSRCQCFRHFFNPFVPQLYDPLPPVRWASALCVIWGVTIEARLRWNWGGSLGPRAEKHPVRVRCALLNKFSNRPDVYKLLGYWKRQTNEKRKHTKPSKSCWITWHIYKRRRRWWRQRKRGGRRRTMISTRRHKRFAEHEILFSSKFTGREHADKTDAKYEMCIWTGTFVPYGCVCRQSSFRCFSIPSAKLHTCMPKTVASEISSATQLNSPHYLFGPVVCRF